MHLLQVDSDSLFPTRLTQLMQINKLFFLGLVISSFLLKSCSSADQKNKLMGSVPIEDQWSVGMNDTVLVQQTEYGFIEYELIGDSVYRIVWGNEQFRNKSAGKFEVSGQGLMSFYASDDSEIVLGRSCGTSCNCLVVLPLVLNATEKVYQFAQAIDLKRNLVAFVPENAALINFVNVENYHTGETLNIEEYDVCGAAFKGDCIDTVYFEDGNVVVKWQGVDWGTNRPDPQVKKIPIAF